MKRILVTGAGGTAALNFTRSLRMAGEPFHLIGVDSNPHYLVRTETDEAHLVPRADDPEYLAIIRQVIDETGAELIFAQPDVEIAVLSEHREELGTRTFWPRRETVAVCQDKYGTYSLWNKAGLRVPDTKMLRVPADLKAFMEEHGDVWLRAVRGAAGKGSFHTSNLDQALAWIQFNGGWETFSAAEYLSPDSVTWQSIWNHGELVVAQSRRRLYWEFGDRAPSGITGITGAAVTVSDKQVDEISVHAIRAVDRQPHGIFSVDLTYDSEGVPNPTEINIGRFFTTHLFFTVAGLNMPDIAVRLAYGEPTPKLDKKVNPLPAGLLWVRGMDKDPVLTRPSMLQRSKDDLEARRAEHRQTRLVRV
ncbi:MAG: carboxylate--amine ligase [Chloroflexi bacterium]|nr:carboxylate--amine ligase [Chloroflexota bacterium]